MDENLASREYWQLEADIFNRIYETGLTKYVTEMVPNIDRAFESKNSSVCCMDEGIKEGKLRITGSGILEPVEIEDIAKILLEAGIDLVTSHEECGGARLAYLKENKNAANEDIDQATIDQFAIDWSKRVAAVMSRLKGE